MCGRLVLDAHRASACAVMVLALLTKARLIIAALFACSCPLIVLKRPARVLLTKQPDRSAPASRRSH